MVTVNPVVDATMAPSATMASSGHSQFLHLLSARPLAAVATSTITISAVGRCIRCDISKPSLPAKSSVDFLPYPEEGPQHDAGYVDLCESNKQIWCEHFKMKGLHTIDCSFAATINDLITKVDLSKI